MFVGLEKGLIMMKIQSTKTMPRTRSRWMLVGGMGSGKTTIASTFPDPLFIVPKGENSMETLRSRGLDIPFVEVGPENCMDDLGSIFNELLATQKKNPDDLPAQTLVWESLTHFSSWVVDELSAGNSKKPGEMNEHLWGKVKNFFTHSYDLLCQLDMYVVLTAHPKVELGEQRQVLSAGPRIMGGASELLPACCEHYGYCEVIPGKDSEKDIFKVYFKKYGGFEARTRSSTLPREIVNFNFKEIEKLI